VSEALKSLVEKIIADPAFCKAFIAKPNEILKSHVISRSERRALVLARRRLLLAGPDPGLATGPFEWP
jgi:hypothetical protein